LHVLQVEPQIKTNYVAGGQVRLTFWYVADYGEPSLLAHRVVECAGRQDPLAFWQMHDLLFERQGQLWNASNDTVVQFATELGLDGEAFGLCLDDPAVGEKVTRLDQERRAQGIRTRPSFDVNGQLIPGAIPYQRFAQVLDEVLAQE
jgi:protein-disulfide isomerase